MSRFNLEDYETVEVRLARFWQGEQAKDARIVTINRSTEADRAKGVWVFEARLYLTAGDQSMDLPKVTGWASETETGNQAQWAAELAETSSIGRCLANLGLSGNKRASREEMQKVARAARDWLGEAGNLTNRDDIRLLWAEARAAGVSKETLDKVAEIGQGLPSAGGLSPGNNRGPKGSPTKRQAG